MARRYRLSDLMGVMARLRGPGGCPWDRKQTHRSLLRNLKEESAEVVSAIRKNDMENLCEELGDLLLQIAFHATLAKEKNRFTMDDVIDGLCRKLIRRHPHVFGQSKARTVKEVLIQWKKIKQQEKAARAK